MCNNTKKLFNFTIIIGVSTNVDWIQYVWRIVFNLSTVLLKQMVFPILCLGIWLISNYLIYQTSKDIWNFQKFTFSDPMKVETVEAKEKYEACESCNNLPRFFGFFFQRECWFTSNHIRLIRTETLRMAIKRFLMLLRLQCKLYTVVMMILMIMIFLSI